MDRHRMGFPLVLFAVVAVSVPAAAQEFVQVVEDSSQASKGPVRVDEQTPPSGEFAAAVSAVDEMFRAGSPRAAARQYAKLSLRFGASELLLTRRFVAQVASGDFEQALVIRSLARLLKLEISNKTLPGRSLAGLGISPPLAELLSEELAALTILQATDPERLDVIAAWLRINGEDKRSELFSKKAAQIRNAEVLPGSPEPLVVTPSSTKAPKSTAPAIVAPLAAPAVVPVPAAESPRVEKPAISLFEPLRSNG